MHFDSFVPQPPPLLLLLASIRMRNYFEYIPNGKSQVTWLNQLIHMGVLPGSQLTEAPFVILRPL